VIKGMAVSRGIGRGSAYVMTAQSVQVGLIEEGDTGREVSRFRSALREAESQLSGLYQKVREGIGSQAAEVFTAQALILNDSYFLQRVSVLIETQRMNVEGALSQVIDQASHAFVMMEDPYIRERAADIRDVGRRILSILASQTRSQGAAIPEGTIIVADELLPSLIADLEYSKVRALVTGRGGKMGHAAILARSLGIPVVSDIREATAAITTGDLLIVDGSAGLVFINPNESIVREYEKLEGDFRAERETMKALVHLPACTRDGVTVKLFANIGKTADVDAALLFNADGIGLFRTEFGFLIRDHFPTEEEQYGILKNVAEQFHPRPVTVRLLDLGGDKGLPYFPLAQTQNPALSERGIRLMLKHRNILGSQLRAILRASADHPVSILIPMISGLEEVREVRHLLESVKESFKSEGRGFNSSIRLGVMIETPAAALMVGALAREVDFFSLGTNDLVQYILVADRGDPGMEPYYRPAHPALLKIIRSVIRTINPETKDLAICGEIAGDPFYFELLLGLGLRCFSVVPTEILEIKNIIRSISLPEAEKVARQALTMSTALEVENFLEKRWQAKNPVVREI
jgi:phosphoenolpyruvate-protein phosphotransferase